MKLIAVPDTIWSPRCGRAAERSREQLALEADIDDARTLGIEPGEGGQDQRNRKTYRALEDRNDFYIAHGQIPEADLVVTCLVFRRT